MNYYIQGDAAKAEEIKAAFKEKGFDADWCPITRESLYFTVNGIVHLTDSDNIYAEIIKTHPDYKELELPKPHYDIKNFKPFDKVLTRNYDTDTWAADWFSYYVDDEDGKAFITTCAYRNQCIPFNEETKHLLGTTEICLMNVILTGN